MKTEIKPTEEKIENIEEEIAEEDLLNGIAGSENLPNGKFTQNCPTLAYCPRTVIRAWCP